jgi:hypothetical protein
MQQGICTQRTAMTGHQGTPVEVEQQDAAVKLTRHMQVLSTPACSCMRTNACG